MTEVRIQPVYFVLQPNTLLLDVAGPAEALRMANYKQGAVRFALQYVASAVSIDSSIGLELTGLKPLPESVPDDAMIVVAGAVNEPIPSPHPKPRRELAQARRLAVEWLRRIARPTHKLVFICSGSLLAAEAGILDGRACTTHHSDCGELARLAPTGRVLDNRIFVSDGNVHTSAGVTAGLDLMLHLIAEMTTPACALSVARNMVVYLRRTGGDPQLSPWLEGRNHVHPAVHRVQDAIAAEPAREWTGEDLAGVAFTSPRHLTRLFQEHAGMSPVDFIHKLRLALAREMITNSQLDLEMVAEKSGFGSGRQMRRVWRKYYESPPVRLRALR